ncbi:dienelactone hydrolase family protein [Lysobacter sp. D1-1-M9]|uniref:dienelactone hydrolase family protein n=1 Tax=Novilysobacter longmucuonensis TaxID=3098603 RepID=UPI002FCA9BCB
MRSHRLAAALPLLLCAAPAFAAMTAEPVEWSIGEDAYRGVLVYDDATPAVRPGLVMVPNWRGINPAAVEQAGKIAGDDYVVLVADVYGSEVRPKDNQEAGQAAGPLLKDRERLRTRIEKAVEVLRAQAGSAPLDAGKIGALGFCFGGSTVLELVRGGSNLAGVVSLHGGLETPLPAEPSSAGTPARTPVLVLNGAEDRAVTDQDIGDFEQEMDAADADWQFVNFGGAVHCFAEPSAGDDPESNCRYDARAAERAYRMMDGFFRERFAAE